MKIDDWWIIGIANAINDDWWLKNDELMFNYYLCFAPLLRGAGTQMRDWEVYPFNKNEIN